MLIRVRVGRRVVGCGLRALRGWLPPRRNRSGGREDRPRPLGPSVMGMPRRRNPPHVRTRDSWHPSPLRHPPLKMPRQVSLTALSGDPDLYINRGSDDELPGAVTAVWASGEIGE